MTPRKNQTFSHQQNIWIVTNYGEFKSYEGNSASTSNCHDVSFLTVTPSPELSTDLWPPLTSHFPSLQVLSEAKLSKKTLIQINLSKSTFHRILKKDIGLHPYKMQIKHELQPNVSNSSTTN